MSLEARNGNRSEDVRSPASDDRVSADRQSPVSPALGSPRGRRDGRTNDESGEIVERGDRQSDSVACLGCESARVRVRDGTDRRVGMAPSRTADSALNGENRVVVRGISYGPLYR